MSGILDTVNQRTQLVGQNRLELLTFRLMRKQRYGINVFKVKEVLQCPKLTSMPNLHPLVKGVAHIRGQTISVIDMSLATGGLPITDPENRFIIISEFNRSTQGFLVGSVERIVNMHWEAILPPPEGTGSSNYLTAVTEIEGELVEILDVEKILNQISPVNEDISEEVLANKPVFEEGGSDPTTVLVADDSSVARRQVKRAVETIGYNVVLAHDGRDALEKLQVMAAEGTINDLALVISDIEMPEMDGYTLTTEIKKDPSLKDIHVVLHSSLSGVFNEAMVQRVGADAFIPKFDPDELGEAVMNAVKGQEN
ncbi:chemotaxis protein CheW [Enterovibrio norvegicus]|uniref:Two-component system, chemotaxis family, response regulator CheV n=2 Tax=Enterovibrio norvegicus TaxID=188144 RepID=A0A1I5TS12_9GAMM|nr:chemotaxis protein CheV [Enterovibrio norvegicus]MCC4798967.1 chemotaxis protein CheV [Enterovibrio norvegicus]OEE61900.1 chemotaxis protein CheW [Enterovibrio norvegicus]OEF58906.1 chemotaxis protein CheW [Enterovibrio norvegicus]OEF59523.1 chemotaxis protein CheW [Enterovibrio norvegicus]PMI29395.1 chemotaxis protein CheW [Enterovibrio norvegicus]